MRRPSYTAGRQRVRHREWSCDRHYPPPFPEVALERLFQPRMLMLGYSNLPDGEESFMREVSPWLQQSGKRAESAARVSEALVHDIGCRGRRIVCLLATLGLLL